MRWVSQVLNPSYVLRLNANINGGVTDANFVAWLEWWKLGLRRFKQHLKLK